MLDPEVVRAVNELALTIGGVATGKPFVEKTFLPTAEYFGQSLRGLVERYGNVNVLDVLHRARRRLGAAATEPGAVPPRIFKHVFEEASFVDDTLTREYFAAVLAAARTADGVDDSALQLVAVLRDLPAHQVRLHYLSYFVITKYFGGAPGAGRRLIVPRELLARHANLSSARGVDIGVLGLVRQSLLDPTSGPAPSVYGFDERITLGSTVLGHELFSCVADDSAQFLADSDLHDMANFPLSACSEYRDSPQPVAADDDEWWKDSEEDEQRQADRERERKEYFRHIGRLVEEASDGLALQDIVPVEFRPELLRELEHAVRSIGPYDPARRPVSADDQSEANTRDHERIATLRDQLVEYRREGYWSIERDGA